MPRCEKHFLRGLGVLICGITLLVYSLLLIDTLVFMNSLKTWDSHIWISDPTYHVLKQSLFWVQYVAFCKLISPNIAGILLWKFGGILLGIGLGVFQKNSWAKKICLGTNGFGGLGDVSEDIIVNLSLQKYLSK